MTRITTMHLCKQHKDPTSYSEDSVKLSWYHASNNITYSIGFHMYLFIFCCYTSILLVVSIMAHNIELEADRPFPSTPTAVLEGYILEGGQCFHLSIDRAVSQKELKAEPLTLGVYR
jgi:hypothetical protein